MSSHPCRLSWFAMTVAEVVGVLASERQSTV
jgi:hypothetical protein